MTSTDTIEYNVKGFDNGIYKRAQIDALKQRISKFQKGRLYLEIGGKFLHDAHAARVLPGFDPKVKIEIFKEIGIPFDIVFCINAQDIKDNRFIKNDTTPYIDFTDKMIQQYEDIFGIKPILSLNLINEDNESQAKGYKEKKRKEGFKVFDRYYIPGYPDPKVVVSDNGYGKDEHIKDLNKLVLVVGPASNSGKMSTCLGQIYHDKRNGENSGYAKYETFPIWNLPVNHPVNLAYEAATVDIGDFNLIDKYHLYYHNITAVNYNRDLAAFVIITALIKNIVDKDNFISTYKSPTDMGVNTAGQGITNDEIVCVAGFNEILRRKEWYLGLINEKPEANKWSVRCAELSLRARKYIEKKHYNLEMAL